MSAAWPAETRGVPLWAKLAAFGAVAIVATHAVHLAVGTRVASDALLREQHQLGRGVAALVASQAADPVLVEDTVALDELVVRTARTRGIGYCLIVRDGAVLASSLPPGVGERLVGLRPRGEAGPIVAVDGDRRYLDLSEPILKGRAGEVRLGIDMGALQSTRRAIAVPLGMVAAAAIVLTILLALLVGKHTARPIEQIIEAADRFDPAQPGDPIPPRGGREVAALARRFNGMTARLRAAQEEQERVRVRALAAERLATLGSLVAGVAHEVNNPLASLKSATAMLRVDGTAEQRAGDLDIVDRALDQIGAIVRRLLDFGRERPLELAPVPPSGLAKEATELAALQLKRRGIGIDPATEPGFDDAPVLADRKQVSQALLNLILNAAYVSKDYARLRLRLRRRGPFRGIAVEDDGPGIPEELRGRVFEPFFSTKPEGQGTGLGLPGARAIADRHHGALELEFPRAGGTIATLWLPTPPPAPKPEPRAPDAGPGGDAAGPVDAAGPMVTPGAGAPAPARPTPRA